MRKKNQIAVFFGIFLLLFGIASGIVLLQQNTIFRLRANPKVAVSQVWITNVSDNSATITWMTSRPTAGFLKWNQTGYDLNKIAFPNPSGSRLINTVNLNSLSALTPYSFNISLDGINFKNGEYDWSFKTAQKLNISPESYFIDGQVLTQNNIPVENAMILVNVSGSSGLSTITDKDGNWSIDISKARTQTLSNYVTINQQSSILEINVYSANLSKTIKTIPSLAKNLNISLY